MKEESMKLTKLPVIRKKLGIKEQVQGIPFDKLEAGDVLVFPDKKNKEFIITFVSKYGGYVHYVPSGKVEQANKKDMQGVMVMKNGLHSPQPIEVA